ncbi:S41 family peptidase [Acinetobacter sp. Tr-809]|uniref:S41 family peptidase n=1 Tax=Acinetobacter sp. Tr-809 TaxID=2608324 RepID=UPI001D182833|nr:S41 family peptidase [Acinetobacter sp. Tr-809]
MNPTSSSDQRLIETQKLSEFTSYIKVTSFREGVKEKLENVIQKNQDNIRTAPYIIIDVRENNGGNDSNYLPLMQLLGHYEYWFQSPKLFSTPENIKAWAIYKTLLNNSSDNESIDEIITRMQTQPWNWVSLFDTDEIKHTINKQDTLAHPQKVIILMSSECGSSCEQFILTVKQNPNIITMGQNTYGTIAASNMLEKLTPSNKIYLSYAGTHVNLGIKDVDRLGIPPQIKLTKPQNKTAYDAEVSLAQRLLENEKL